TKALNFIYKLSSGTQGSLYKQKSVYTLLFINNPGCHACTETIEALKNAPIINQLLEQKRLTVLSIYPDEELDEWRKHLNEFPKEWVNGYDKTFAIKEQQLYDLKAIPTLYLLNKDKTVLLKDAPAQTIEEYLLMKGEQ
ncbi:MAG: thioredoxin family protein, partial [Bacteroides xylanisolvens]